jgi:hypothetical protein
MHDCGAEPGQDVKGKLALGANPALIGCAYACRLGVGCLAGSPGDYRQGTMTPCGVRKPDQQIPAQTSVMEARKLLLSLLSSRFAVKVASKIGTISTRSRTRQLTDLSPDVQTHKI